MIKLQHCIIILNYTPTIIPSSSNTVGIALTLLFRCFERWCVRKLTRKSSYVMGWWDRIWSGSITFQSEDLRDIIWICEATARFHQQSQQMKILRGSHVAGSHRSMLSVRLHAHQIGRWGKTPVLLFISVGGCIWHGVEGEVEKTTRCKRLNTFPGTSI